MASHSASWPSREPDGPVHTAPSIAWAKTLTEKDLDTPTPERLRSFIPTVAALLLLLPTHLAMHVGQIQVTRRKLDKPILF